MVNHFFFLLVWHDGSSNHRICWWVPHSQKTQGTIHLGCLYHLLSTWPAVCNPRWSICSKSVWLPVWRCFSSVFGFLWDCNLGLDIWYRQICSWHWENDWMPARTMVEVLLEVLCTSHHGWNLFVQYFTVGWSLLRWLQVSTLGRIYRMASCFVIHASDSWSCHLAVVSHSWHIHGGKCSEIVICDLFNRITSDTAWS